MTRRLRSADPAQLDLFAAAVTHAPPPGVPIRAPQPDEARPRVAPPAEPTPLIFDHPNAQRRIRLGEHLVAYSLRRARRRSIGFVVDVDGLSVAAPRWVTLADIEAALLEKQAWILRKLAEQQERVRRRQAARVTGATAPACRSSASR